MGFSKKKMKAKVKADRRVGPKAKKKAKEARRIEAREEIKASKRKATAATGGEDSATGPSTEAEAGDLASEVRSVDALFAKMAAEEDEDEADGSDASSAGAFCDVDGGSDDEDGGGVRPEDLDDDEGVPEADAQHVEELKALREKDPEFYNFLMQEDRSLLDFRAEEAAGGKEGEAGAEAGEETGLPAADATAAAAPPSGKLLTAERLHRIQGAAKASFTACKAALNAYHTAVRSIEEGGAAEAQARAAEEAEEEEGRSRRNKRSAAKRKKERQGLLRIESEAVFSEVLEWSVANMLGLFRHHAGELQGDAQSRRSKKKLRGKKKQQDARRDTGFEAGVIDPSEFARWKRVKVIVQIYWEETFFLLSHLVAPQMLEYVLRASSTPEALSWLWPFKSLRNRYFKRCCTLWSTSTSHSVRLLAFLFIRNSAAMALQAPDADFVGKSPQLETIIRTVLKSFAEVASWGYSWRSLSTFRFMENCLLELLRLEDATSYRIGYVCIRQLALILRNACIVTSQSGPGAKAKAKGDSTKVKKKGAGSQQQNLVTWPFVRAVSLWTKACGTIPSLQPLAYPLSMITTGAVKSKITSLQYFPFVYHCLGCLNRLGASLEAFVPISSHLLKAFTMLLQAMDKQDKRKPGAPTPSSGKTKGMSGTRAPDVEVLLHFSEGQVTETLSLEVVGSSLCFLMTDHLGLLSQSPAFPEISAPVFLHLKRFSKHCRSESLRQQLRSLVAVMEGSAEDVRVRREALTEAPSAKKLLIFEADTKLAKARKAAIERRAAEERSRVDAELREEPKATKAEKAKPGMSLERLAEGEDAEIGPKNQKKRKGEAKRKREAAEKAAGNEERPREETEGPKDKPAAEDQKEKVKKRRKGVGLAPGREDLVEDMAFSSGGEDE